METPPNGGEVNNANGTLESAPMKAPVMLPVFCVYCSTRLMYPAGAARIQCPQCNQQMDPSQPQQSTCQNCLTLLAHPADCKWIQCPNCLTTMDARTTHEGRALTQPYVPNNNDMGDAGALLSKTNGSAEESGSMGGTNLPRNQPLELNLLLQEQKAAKQREPLVVPKKRKDPNAPKSVSNAYMIFCKATRPKLRAQHSNLKFGQIGAKLGAMWRTMSAQDKKPYEILANKDRERYRHEMILYSAAVNSHPTKRLKENGSMDYVPEVNGDVMSVVDGESGVEESVEEGDTGENNEAEQSSESAIAEPPVSAPMQPT